MKLTYEQQKEIYKKHCQGIGDKELSRNYCISWRLIHYMCKLADTYGIAVLKHGKNRRYSKEFKEKAILRVLNGESRGSVSLSLGITGTGTIHNWMKKYEENGGRIIEKKRGRPPMPGKKPKKAERKLTAEEKIKKLEEENLYLRTENAYLKKLDALVQERQAREQGKKPKSSKS
jgi:transposase